MARPGFHTPHQSNHVINIPCWYKAGIVLIVVASPWAESSSDFGFICGPPRKMKPARLVFKQVPGGGLNITFGKLLIR